MLKTIVVDGQTYTRLGSTNYTNRRGETRTMPVWLSACADCGAPFRFMGNVKRWPSRRCDKHKSPGKRVSRKSLSLFD